MEVAEAWSEGRDEDPTNDASMSDDCEYDAPQRLSDDKVDDEEGGAQGHANEGSQWCSLEEGDTDAIPERVGVVCSDSLAEGGEGVETRGRPDAEKEAVDSSSDSTLTDDEQEALIDVVGTMRGYPNL